MIKCGRLAAPVKIGGGGCVGLTVAGIGVISSVSVVVGGMGVKVGMGVSVDADVVADAQAANTTAKNAMNIIFFIFTFYLFGLKFQKVFIASCPTFGLECNLFCGYIFASPP